MSDSEIFNLTLNTYLKMNETALDMSIAVELEKNPISLYSSPLSLKQISSFNMALQCWRHKWSLYPDQNVMNLCLNSSDSLRLSIPRSIERLINSYIELLRVQLDEWITFHLDFFERNSFDNDTFILSKCFDSIVCETSSPQICYKSTARNLLSNNKLNSYEKFQIACAYCFDGEIKNLWPFVKDKKRDGKLNYGEYSAEYYWDCCLRNEVHRNHLDSDMYSKINMYPLSKIDYFWNELKWRDLKFEVQKNTTNEYCRSRVLKYMLPKLKKSLLDDILKIIPEQIIAALALDVESCMLALQIWTYIKNFLVEEQFFKILLELWRLTLDCRRRISFQPHLANLLDDIWTTASDNLKNYILKHRINRFFEYRTYCHYSGTFLLHLLKGTSFKRRQKLWLKNWQMFINSSSVSQLDTMMKLCFKNEKDVRQFKEGTMLNYEISKYDFIFFIQNRSCSEVDDYLKFCSTDEECVRNLRRKIITSILNRKSLTNFDFEYCSTRKDQTKGFLIPKRGCDLDPKSFAEFNDFVDGSFVSNDLAAQFKEKFVLDNLDFLRSNIPRFLKLSKNLINYFLTSEKCLSEVKQALYETCHSVLSNPDEVYKQVFKIQEWQALLECCAPNQEELSRFKVSLPLDQIFDTMLTQVIRKAMRDHDEFIDLNLAKHTNFSYFDSIADSFKCLNDFLRWYFENDQTITTFKLKRINNYKQENMIGKMFAKENDKIMHIMLMWFFDSDETEVEKFNRR